MPEVSEWLMIFSSDVLRIHLSQFSLKILTKADHFLRIIRAKPPVGCNSLKKKKKYASPDFISFLRENSLLLIAFSF